MFGGGYVASHALGHDDISELMFHPDFESEYSINGGVLERTDRGVSAARAELFRAQAALIVAEVEKRCVLNQREILTNGYAAEELSSFRRYVGKLASDERDTAFAKFFGHCDEKG